MTWSQGAGEVDLLEDQAIALFIRLLNELPVVAFIKDAVAAMLGQWHDEPAEAEVTTTRQESLR